LRSGEAEECAGGRGWRQGGAWRSGPSPPVERGGRLRWIGPQLKAGGGGLVGAWTPPVGGGVLQRPSASPARHRPAHPLCLVPLPPRGWRPTNRQRGPLNPTKNKHPQRRFHRRTDPPMCQQWAMITRSFPPLRRVDHRPSDLPQRCQQVAMQCPPHFQIMNSTTPPLLFHGSSMSV